MKIVRRIELENWEKEMFQNIITWFADNTCDLEKNGIDVDRDLYEVICDILDMAEVYDY